MLYFVNLLKPYFLNMIISEENLNFGAFSPKLYVRVTLDFFFVVKGRKFAPKKKKAVSF